MRILIVAAGSHGDVLPFIALAREFQRRGHAPIIYALGPFDRIVTEAGVPFRSLVPTEYYGAMLRNPNLNHPMRVLGVVAEGLDLFARTTFEEMSAEVVPGETLVVASSLAFVARSVAEAHRLPVAVVHLSPSILRTNYEVPRHNLSIAPMRRMPRFLKAFQWLLADSLLIDRTLGAALNRHRIEVGLPPIRRALHSWLNQADVVLGMFPNWFASPQPDWPANLHLTDFPLYDYATIGELPKDAQEFLDAGDRPVVFTAGTATALSREFFGVSAEACRLAGRRGILLTAHPDQIPTDLPPGVAAFGYLPFSALLPQIAAMVHHGGIGTMSQAFRAGVPQLVRPSAHDQFDNSVRAMRLGVALELAPKAYQADNVAASIERLLTDDAIQKHCRGLAGRIAPNGVQLACDRLLQAMGTT